MAAPHARVKPDQISYLYAGRGKCEKEEVLSPTHASTMSWRIIATLLIMGKLLLHGRINDSTIVGGFGSMGCHFFLMKLLV